ncbi:MAG: hypothetical protein ACRDKW_09595, partial [Actinomycetota bacterium]
MGIPAEPTQSRFPVSLGALAFGPALYSAYLPVWLSDQGESGRLLVALTLAAFGLGRVLGPLTVPWLSGRLGLARALRASLAALAATLLVTTAAAGAVDGGALHPVVMLFLFVLVGVGTSA